MEWTQVRAESGLSRWVKGNYKRWSNLEDGRVYAGVNRGETDDELMGDCGRMDVGVRGGRKRL